MKCNSAKNSAQSACLQTPKTWSSADAGSLRSDFISCPLVLFYRSTWVVFPYTLLFLCWHSLALRAGKIFSLIKEKKNKPVTADAPKGFMLGASTAMGWVLLWGFQDHMQNKIDVYRVAHPLYFEIVTDLICQAKGETGQAPVPTPTLETNNVLRIYHGDGQWCCGVMHNAYTV